MSLNDELLEVLKQEGCGVVGFADISVLPEEPRKNLETAVIMATFYAPEAVRKKMKNVPEVFANETDTEIPRLDRYNKAAFSFLRSKKYKANVTYSKGEITYKMLATLAGIGWVGRCALLVTDKTGPALRFTAVLTNAPFDCGTPITESKCPSDCSACSDACPANAVKGGLWERGVHRDTFFDVKACMKHRSKCGGKCISVCPYTLKGIGCE